MKSSPIVASCLLLLGGCAAVKPATGEDDRASIISAVVALDERWGDAASRGDVSAALDCFHPIDGFSFVYDGGTMSSFGEFEDLTRRSYSSRASLEAANLGRHVLVVNSTVAMLTGETSAMLAFRDGTKREAKLQYGLLCTKVAGEWKIVHAYEFAGR